MGQYRIFTATLQRAIVCIHGLYTSKARPGSVPAGKVALPLHNRNARSFCHEAPVATAATEHCKLRLLKPMIGARPAFQCIEIK